jgi:holo-[acyl-carrier protein] synthase
MRVGIDLVCVDAVQESIATHAERYLRRIYTDREIDDCTSAQGVDPRRLAARFAAKEATIKALRAGYAGISWRTIEVLRNTDGSVELELSGPAADLAVESGLTAFALSITHDGEYASAVVVASGA